MTEGKRQRQVAGVIQEEMNDIFRRLGLNMINGGMVSISSVKVTRPAGSKDISKSF